MKTKIFILSAFALLVFAGGVKAAKERYKLSFTINGWQHKVCYLGFYYGGTPYVILTRESQKDSAVADTKGHFEFAADSLLPGGVYFAITSDKKQRIEFLMDKDQEFSIRADTTDFINSVKVEGSEENALFYNYQRFIGTRFKEMEKYKKQKDNTMADSIGREIKRYTNKLISAHSDMFLAKLLSVTKEVDVPPSPRLPNGRIDSTFPYHYYKSHYFDNIDLTDGMLVRSPVLLEKIKFYLEKLTVPIPDSIIAAADYIIAKTLPNKDMFRLIVGYITDKYETSSVMGMDAVFVHMVQKHFSNGQAYWIDAKQLDRLQQRATQLAPILIGEHAPPLVMPDTSRAMQALDSIKARYTVVYFWNYDCIHCQKETPKLIKWYDSVRDEGIQVYAVEENEQDLKKWTGYIVKNKLDWINVSDIFHTSNFHYQYDVIITPTIYVLDENKNIIAKKIDVEDLDKVIKHDMEEKDRNLRKSD